MQKRYHGFIYLTTNLLNGKRYIGQTTKKETITYFGSGKAILKALTKYGKENFSREILAYAFNKADLDALEIEFIKEYQALGSELWYNIAEGGKTTRGFTGKSHTAEHKETVRQLMLTQHPNKGKQFGSDIREKMSNAKTGYSYGTWSLETDDGVIEVSCLTTWCKERGLDYGAVKRTLKGIKPRTNLGVKVLAYTRH